MKVVFIMIPDSRDTILLRLIGRYRWLPYDMLDRFGFEGLGESIRMLGKCGLLSVSRSKQYLNLTPKGYDLLGRLGFEQEQPTKRAYANSVTLRRRLESASIMLTALRAGIDTLRDDIDSLRGQPVFLPSFAFRSAAMNPMSNCSCAGFGHWGDKAYMLHYVSPGSKGMFLINELQTFHNLSSVFSDRLDEPEAMVIAGSSYRQAYGQVMATTLSSRHGVRGFNDFADVYRRVDMPVHLLSCNDAGAMQLALMRQPGYIARIAHAAFGSRWSPHDDSIPEADGLIDGNRTLLIAADMDIRRAGRVVGEAKRLGNRGVALVAFKAQLEELIMGLFPRDGNLVHLRIEQPVLDVAFGKGFSLCPLDGKQEEGDIHA